MNAIPKRKWRRSETWLLVAPSLLLPLAWLWSATRPAPIPVVPPPLYRVSDLGTLGGAGGYVSGMNDHGDVVGRWGSSTKNARPFVMRNGKMQLIGTGKGGMTVASDINNAGEVAGTSGNPDGTYDAFSWRNGKLTLLPSLGGKESYASAINERGQIVGYAQTRFKRPDGYYEGRAVLWEKGRVRDLNVPGENSSFGRGINNQGEIVGTGNSKSFLWRDGVVTDVGEAGAYTDARGINDSGLIVGITSGQLLLWNDKQGQKAQMPAGIQECFAPATNNAGQSIGYAFMKRRVFAFLYQNNQMHDLNALAPGSGWMLTNASAINERGQIVGMGQFKSKSHGFLLTPITR